MSTLLHTALDALFEKIHRCPFYYRRYNNTISYRLNTTYLRYARACAQAYAREHGHQSPPPSPLCTEGAMCLRNVYPEEKTRAASAKITELIDKKDPRAVYPKKFGDLQVRIEPPLQTIGTDLLEVFHAPVIHEAMLSFFQGHYRILWVSIYRTIPAQRVASSWLWHCDGYPPRTCKLFLHLTQTTAETGATEFMNLEDTMAYRRAGYFGQHLGERYADLEEFARDHHLPYHPFHFDAAPGDATVFDMNFFHRAISPRTGFRDVVQFYLLPNPIPWDEQLRKDGIESLAHVGSGYPKDPRPAARAATLTDSY